VSSKSSRREASARAAQLFAAALADHRAGRLAQAQAAYGRALAADPKHAPSLHYLGVLALQAGRPAEALDLIGKAVALEPDEPESQYNMALALRALGRHGEAVTHLRRATALKPDFAEPFLHLGTLALQAGNPGEAVAHFQAAVRANPQLADGYFHLAQTLLRFGRLYDALGVINRVFELGLAEARAAEALALVRLALKAEESVDTRTLFVQCVRSLRAVPGDAEIRALMVRALTEP
jgi:tetratricopeptide (TPR) repeat protein